MASRIPDIFKDTEDSIKSTFDELIDILNARRSILLSQLKEIKLKYLESERMREEHLKDLQKLIGQLDSTEPTYQLSQNLQNDFVSNTKKKMQKFLQPTPVSIQGFLYTNIIKFKRILQMSGNILFTPFIRKKDPNVTFGKRGVKPGQLCVPLGISITNSSIFVVDLMNHRIQAFSMEGTYLLKFGWQKLTKPHGVYVDHPFIYVTDSDQNALHKFADHAIPNNSLDFTAEGILNAPLGVVGDKNGSIYVADSENNRIAVFNTENLDFKLEIGKDRLNSPRDVTIHTDNLYVIDYSVPLHVHMFQLDGTHMKSIIDLKGGTGTLFFCIDNSNNIIINNSASSCMQIFNKNGLLIHSIDVKSPGGVAVTKDGDLVCARKYDKEQIAIY
ncbi:NHL repeat containing protein [Oopsacas minuta]|uniref:NHL repeat containing protein n=1 Tax=Oopsacas minuta TaxID=111878 RepID=A0AAV7JW23_9METZ|nr:NHL repeat containing protein [Oopsacas minuta]